VRSLPLSSFCALDADGGRRTSSDLALSKSTIARNADFSVSVTVKNGGSIAAKEVVQVYATDLFASAVTANTQLVGFAKVEIP
jgi:beta-glucosidase